MRWGWDGVGVGDKGSFQQGERRHSTSMTCHPGIQSRSTNRDRRLPLPYFPPFHPVKPGGKRSQCVPLRGEAEAARTLSFVGVLSSGSPRKAGWLSLSLVLPKPYEDILMSPLVYRHGNPRRHLSAIAQPLGAEPGTSQLSCPPSSGSSLPNIHAQHTAP